MQARLQEIRDRAERATDGEWEIISESETIGFGYVYSSDVLGTAIANCNMPAAGRSNLNIKNNAKFIAHSRQDIPYLLDALKQAQEENKKLFSESNYARKINKQLKKNWQKDKQQLQDRERVLMDFIDTQFCQNFKIYGKTTNCHHPDNGLCDKYYDCRKLHKALKEDKP